MAWKSVAARYIGISPCSWNTIGPHAYSSTRSHAAPEKKVGSGKEDDPFGLGEVLDTDRTGNVLVQGFYSSTAENQGNPAASQENLSRSQSTSPHPGTSPPPPQPPPSPMTQAEREKQNRLSQYDDWLKGREKMNAYAGARGEIGGVDAFRETHFGKVRIDSDNPVMSEPHSPNDIRLDMDQDKYQASKRKFRSRLNNNDLSNEPIVETIEADHSIRMRASDFLKQIKGKQTSPENDEENEEAQGFRKKLIIERVVWPRNSEMTDINHPSVAALAKEDASFLDSNVVPKPYLLPDYRGMTEQDVWSILRKSIIFQNDFLFAINKPPGIPVQKKSRNCHHSVMKFIKNFADLVNCEQAHLLHRLDKEATGVLLFAKDKKVAAVLSEKFANREVKKVYLVASKLCPRIPEGTIKIPIGEGIIPGTTKKYRSMLRPDLRDYGIQLSEKSCKEAITHYRVLQSIKEASFLEVEPVTGIKHQIRVHLGMGLGCPIIGDHKYSHRDRLAPQRLDPYVLHKIKVKQSKVREIPLHLHCNKISFTLPKEFTNSTEPVYIHANIPIYMKYTLRNLGLIR